MKPNSKGIVLVISASLFSSLSHHPQHFDVMTLAAENRLISFYGLAGLPNLVQVQVVVALDAPR